MVPSQPVELSRRSMLTGIGAAALVLGHRTVSTPRVGRVPAGFGSAGDPFALGVASGDPRSDGVVLWTRLAPEPWALGGGLTARPYDVEWRVAADPGLSRVVRSGSVVAHAGAAHAVHVIADGLQAAREYWYQFRCGPWLSPVGRTKTAPSRNARVGRMSLAAASCQAWTDGHFTAHRHLAGEDLDVVLFLGDYVYERAIVADARGVVAAGGVPEQAAPEAETLDAYRLRYALYKSDPDLQAAHRAAPWMVAWDDHEVEDGYAGSSPAGVASPADAMAFRRRRTAAYQAFWEHQPLRVRRPAGPRLRIHRRLRYGSLATVHLLDTRQHRSRPRPGGGWQPVAAAGVDEAPRTMLGDEQERWLTDGITTSGAVWDVVAQQVMAGRLDADPTSGTLVNVDAWDGYPAAQRRLHDTLARSRSPVVLTGDVHAAYALTITDRQSTDDRTVAVELATTSISSGGDGAALLESGRQFVDANPHVRYVNQQRGYLRCTIDDRQLTADFRAVPYVEAPGAPVTTDRTFRIAAGRPEL